MNVQFEKALKHLTRDEINLFKSQIIELDGMNHVDEMGRSLIFHAVLQDKTEAIKILTSMNAKLNIHDKEGWTPLHYAVARYSIEATNLLINSGADIHAKDSNGNNVLWRAVFTSKGRGDIIKILLQAGADPLMKNNSGISPLQLANTIANYDVKIFLNQAKSKHE